ncbi:MAG: ArsR/SmtB family transcription factor [Candidatus Thorarchaeota archaeon]
MDHLKNQLDEVFSALSHPVRRAIIEQVAVKECTVNELAKPHKITRPAISQHLRILLDASLIEQTKKGRFRMCHLNVRPLSVAFNWLVRYRVFWETLLDEIQEKVEADANLQEDNQNAGKT